MARMALKKRSPSKNGPAKSRALIELVHDSDNLKPVSRFAAADADKLRGGYYTPSEVAKWLCRWAIRTPNDSFLEPSCGDGTILVEGIARLKELGALPRSLNRNVLGIELSPKEADAARTRIKNINATASIVETADFFSWQKSADLRRFTACIGNPPFIRYQSFPEPSRTRAMTLMSSLGLKANKLTNIWVPFVIGAVERLEPGGRLAMVIPAEPTEAERLLVPNALGAALPLAEVDKLVRDGQLEQVLEENDKLVLRKALGLSKADCVMLKDIWAKMRNRRMVRKRKPRTA
jgi:hypothetical protein